MSHHTQNLVRARSDGKEGKQNHARWGREREGEKRDVVVVRRRRRRARTETTTTTRERSSWRWRAQRWRCGGEVVASRG